MMLRLPTRRMGWALRIASRCSSSLQNERRELPRRRVRSPSEYEEYALRREYFFAVDLQGQLYLEETEPKNITTCFKNEKFLAFFFRQLRRNDTGLHTEYPYVSLCGWEKNFVMPDDLPIVFTDMVSGPPDESDLGSAAAQASPEGLDPAGPGEEQYLLSPGGYATALEPQSLVVSSVSGRLYHPARTSAKYKYSGYGLIRSQLAARLSEHFVEVGADSSDEEGPAGEPEAGPTTSSSSSSSLSSSDRLGRAAGIGHAFQWQGRLYPMRLLPLEAEPYPELLPQA